MANTKKVQKVQCPMDLYLDDEKQKLVYEKREQAKNKMACLRQLSAAGAILDQWGILNDVLYMYDRGLPVERALATILTMLNADQANPSGVVESAKESPQKPVESNPTPPKPSSSAPLLMQTIKKP
ncbi:hypothetical protein [Zooshikella sp. RANM57]|uniref:hypothetical protein n=1 Tax=Zooshikella sp. RANM57 TaxID=3425863 RepID=UPI003D6E4C87